jgi:hypothetical protein
MTKKAYILTYNREADTDYNLFHQQLIALPEIITWSHYIKSSYILITEISSATKLNKIILPIMPNGRFLLIEVNLANRNGRLPNAGWTWFQNHVNETK